MADALLKVFLADSICRPKDVIDAFETGLDATLTARQVRAIRAAGYTVDRLGFHFYTIWY